MDNETIAVVAAVVINVVAVAWNIRVTFVLHRQTKELQVSNAKLQSEVNRLSVHLNQEITRLNRIIELTREMYLSSARLGHKRTLSANVGEVSSDRTNTNSSDDELIDFRLTVDSSTIEMQAIANVIGDLELQVRIGLLSERARSINLTALESPEEWFQQVSDFGKLVTDVQEQVYRRLQDVTKST